MRSIKNITLIVIIVSSIAFNACNHASDAEKNEKDKDNRELFEFLLYSKFLPQPELIIYPFDGYYGVSSNTPIEIYFSEPVKQSDNWRVTINDDVYNSESPETFWDTAYFGDFICPVLIIYPRKPLIRFTTTIVTAYGFVSENGGRAFREETSAFSVTGSNLRVSFDPNNNATRVSPDEDVVVTFSEAVDTSTDWSIKIGNSIYNSESPEILWDTNGRVVTINPSGYFQRDASIPVSVSNFIAVYDMAPFPNATSRFTVMSTPSVEISPSNGAKAVPVDEEIIITFSEPMIHDDEWSVTADGVVYTKDSSGATWNDEKTLTIEKGNNFQYLSLISIVVQGFHATLDNCACTNPYSISFATGMKIEDIPMGDAVNNLSQISSTIDSNGGLYVSYYDISESRLKYLTDNEGSWQYHNIETRAYYGVDSAIAIDSSDALRAAYSDMWNADITYAQIDEGSWNMENFDPSTASGNGISLAVDSLDTAHISYWETYYFNNEMLRYASKQGGVWAIDDIASGYSNAGTNSSIAVDSNHKIHISFFADDYLHYATNKNGTWNTLIIDSNRYSGYRSVIAVDSSDAVYIAYHDHSDFSNQCIRYVTNRSGSWERYVIDSSLYIGSLSIGVDSNNVVYVGYTDYVQEEYTYFLKIARIESGGCSIIYADSNDHMGNKASIVIDSNDCIHVFYICGLDDFIMKYGTNTP